MQQQPDHWQRRRTTGDQRQWAIKPLSTHRSRSSTRRQRSQGLLWLRSIILALQQAVELPVLRRLHSPLQVCRV